MDAYEVDCRTGETTVRPLTAEEEQTARDDAAAGVTAEAERDSRAANEAATRQKADAALADLRAVAGTSGTLSGSQLSNAVRLLARVQIVLVRLAIRRFDAAE